MFVFIFLLLKNLGKCIEFIYSLANMPLLEKILSLIIFIGIMVIMIRYFPRRTVAREYESSYYTRGTDASISISNSYFSPNTLYATYTPGTSGNQRYHDSYTLPNGKSVEDTFSRSSSSENGTAYGYLTYNLKGAIIFYHDKKAEKEFLIKQYLYMSKREAKHEKMNSLEQYLYSLNKEENHEKIKSLEQYSKDFTIIFRKESFWRIVNTFETILLIPYGLLTILSCIVTYRQFVHYGTASALWPILAVFVALIIEKLCVSYECKKIKEKKEMLLEK